MRGFTFGAVNVLYNGISIGVSSDTTRVMDLSSLAQVEFLKGPSALMSGMNAIGGSVNYVNNQPTSGPIQNQLDLSVDSLGTFRSHWLYTALHTLDFPALRARPALRTALIVALCGCGFVFSLTGVIIAYRRVRSCVSS
jgi:TonB-dependent Receptor Plug Domain